MLCVNYNGIGQSLRHKVRTLSRGAVAVSMDIKMLDIDQCPDAYHVPNAFKDTHKCDERSSYVSGISTDIDFGVIVGQGQ